MQPKQQAVYPIKESDLKRLEKMIERIPLKGFSYENLGFAGIGGILGGIGILISLKYAQGVSVTFWVVGWLFTFVSLVTSVLSFVFSAREVKEIGATSKSVLDEINHLKESVYSPIEAKANENQTPALRN